nr:DUF998 domain-containing protein [Candidatus Sigynarchaeota archaeon]
MSIKPSDSSSALPASTSFFKMYFCGLLPKEFILKRLFPALLIIQAMAMLVADLVFPTPFDWRYMAISALGYPDDNPSGFWIMSVGGVCLSVLLIPAIGFIYRHLRVICPGAAGLGMIFASIGVVGLILTSVLVGSTILGGRTHENLALIAFAGFLFGLFIWGFPLIKDRMPRYNGKKQFDFRVMRIAFTMIWAIIIGMATCLALNEVVYGNVPGLGSVDISWIDPNNPDFVMPMPSWASFAMWEWLLYWGMLIYFMLLVVMIPPTVEPLLPRTKK